MHQDQGSWGHGEGQQAGCTQAAEAAYRGAFDTEQQAWPGSVVGGNAAAADPVSIVSMDVWFDRHAWFGWQQSAVHE